MKISCRERESERVMSKYRHNKNIAREMLGKRSIIKGQRAREMGRKYSEGRSCAKDALLVFKHKKIKKVI